MPDYVKKIHVGTIKTLISYFRDKIAPYKSLVSKKRRKITLNIGERFEISGKLSISRQLKSLVENGDMFGIVTFYTVLPKSLELVLTPPIVWLKPTYAYVRVFRECGKHCGPMWPDSNEGCIFCRSVKGMISHKCFLYNEWLFLDYINEHSKELKYARCAQCLHDEEKIIGA